MKDNIRDSILRGKIRQRTMKKRNFSKRKKLNEWYDSLNTNYANLAKKLGTTPISIANWLAGIGPNKKNAIKFVKKTKGEISMEDLGW